MKLLFIGGTGRISAAITNLCVANGHQVYLLNRGVRGIVDGAVHLQGDINDEAHVASLIKGHTFDVVANFINYTPAQVARDIRLFAGRTAQYVFISSTAAYQKPLSHYKITESTPLANPFWQYARDKIACENLLMDEYRQSGFPVTIVRPSHTYDRNVVPVSVYGEKGQWQVLQRMLDGKPVLVHGDGLSLWTLTHTDDFAKGFAGLLGNAHALGEAVHITSDESLTWNQIYMLIGRALGVTPQIYHVSSDFLIAANPAYQGNLLGDKAYSVVFDNSKIKRLVPGFCAGIRFDTGVKWAVDNYLAKPEMQVRDPAFDLFCDRVVAACEGAKERFLSL
ncbi:MAG: SDR family oxidoreductase [Defluviitaleaceae bacterium]|nr:SDR family oxidoreductase [Defluviitaleaceae bacterium]